MMKLIKTIICDTNSMNIKDREKYIIPEKYNGRVVLEHWDVNGNIKYKGIVLNSGIRNYLLSLGNFKTDSEISLEYMRKKRLMSMRDKFEIIYLDAMQNIESADDNDILRLELEITGHGVNIKSAVVNTPDDWLEEAFRSTNEENNKEIIKELKNSDFVNNFKKVDEFKKTNERGEELKTILDKTLKVMNGTTRDGITKNVLNDMNNVYQMMENYEKKFLSKINQINTKNNLKNKSIIEKMRYSQEE